MQSNGKQDSNTQSPGRPPQKERVDAQERVDLYEVVKNKREGDPNKALIARLFYIAKLKGNDENKTAIHEKVEANVENMLSGIVEKYNLQNPDNMNKHFTGFMKNVDACSLHFLEGDSGILNIFVHLLYEEFKSDKSYYDQINILAFNEENSQRCFESWGYHSTPAPKIDAFDAGNDKTDQQLNDKAWEIYDKFLQAGSKSRDKFSGKASKDVWRDISTDIKMSPDDFATLLADKYVSLEDYERIFLGDVEITLEDELVFPQAPSLIDILEYSKILKDL